MVSTRGKKKTAGSNETLQENEVAENASAETKTSDSVTVNVEEPKADAQFKDKVHKTVDKARNENDTKYGGEEGEKVTQVDSHEYTIVTAMNGDNIPESEQNTSEDDEIYDQEVVMWEDDEENSEEDDEENVLNEDEVSEEEATEEEDEDEDEVSEDEETEEEGDEEDTKEEKEIAKGDGREAEEHNTEKVEVRLKNIEKSSERSRTKVQAERSKKVDSRDKSESSRKRKAKKRVQSMGMIFMCSSKTKYDCYKYRVLGLPESKKDNVEKIYTGMRLFLYDVDLKLMYGIYKAAGPGGYNIEPKAFDSQFPSQVRFAILDDCLPLAEEKFKKVIKDNYYTKTKFDGQLNSEQVKKLCKLFIASSKGHLSKKRGRSRKAKTTHPERREIIRKQKSGDERRLPALREEHRYRDRPRTGRDHPRKRPRKVISPVAPLRRPLPAPLPSTVPSYAYDRISDVNAYRRDPYLPRRSPYRDGRDPLLNRRDPLLSRRDPYRDGRDPYLERRDLYRDRPRDPFIEPRDPYLDRRDPYRDGGRDAYLESRDPYRDGRDSYAERRGPYRDETHSEPYSTYRMDPISDRRDVYREDRRLEYRDSYRREELLDLQPSTVETRWPRDIVSRDSYVSYRERPSYAEPVYSAGYSPRAGAGLVHEYRL